jgi:hypothetical protein
LLIKKGVIKEKKIKPFLRTAWSNFMTALDEFKTVPEKILIILGWLSGQQ